MIHSIKSYDPDWKTEFERLKKVFIQELNGFEIDVQHVGSTAVPGLSAKPILDIDIIISDKTQLSIISKKLERLGYSNKGDQGIAGRYAFKPSSELTPTTAISKKWLDHHLYVCFSDSLALKNHLAFRNILLKNKDLAEEYSQLKVNLANQEGMTREKYTTLKTTFILKALDLSGFDSEELRQIEKANL